jgi:DNA-binding IclR family transcriptional regulator
MRIVQTLQRGLAILDYLASADGPVRMSDVAAKFNIDKANASRLLQTLLEAGYAERTDGRLFIPGAKMLDDGGRQLEGVIALRERTHSLLEGLVEVSSECAHMAVLVANRVWYIDKVSSPHALRVDHPVGALSPLHCTALGKAFLTFSPKQVPGDLPRFTARTMTDQNELERDLAQARQRGYAHDDEEFSPGVRCVAAPIFDERGRMVAAVGLSGPTARIDMERLADMGRLVRDRSSELSAATRAA